MEQLQLPLAFKSRDVWMVMWRKMCEKHVLGFKSGIHLQHREDFIVDQTDGYWKHHYLLGSGKLLSSEISRR